MTGLVQNNLKILLLVHYDQVSSVSFIWESTTMLSLFAELERDFISIRTKEALRAKKAQGFKLGRPKGRGKSKLDPYREEIIALLKNGSTKAYVSRKYNTSTANLYNWLKRSPEILM